LAGAILNKVILISAFCFLISDLAFPAPWSGILPNGTAIDWSSAGIPGGIPNRTTICTTIPAAACGIGSADCTGTIQNALNSCPAGQVVLLGTGTFLLKGAIQIPGNVTLRGQGADQTILNSMVTTGGGVIQIGQWTLQWASGLVPSGNVLITSGATAGSQSIQVSDASNIQVGKFLLITELNEFPLVSIAGTEGDCTWCSPFNDNGARSLGQVSQVTSVSGNTIGISPGLFRSMNDALPDWSPNTQYPLNAFINPSVQPTHGYQQTFNNGSLPYLCISGASPPAFPTDGSSVTDGNCVWQDIGTTTTTLPLADPFTATQYVGLENLQIYANNTGAGPSIVMNECAYCWVSGVEDNYADGDHVDIALGYHDEIVNSYFSNAFLHTPGVYDSDIRIGNQTTGSLVQNNILERLHASIMMDWGPAGDVIAYNYLFGNFDAGYYFSFFGDMSFHGPHPEFNLFEGNIGDNFNADDIHGSSSHSTSFRDWYKGTTKICEPLSGRSPVSCSPMGVPGNSGVNGWWAVGANTAFVEGIRSSYFNFVGGVAGSQNMANLLAYDSGAPVPEANECVGLCEPNTPSTCGANYPPTGYLSCDFDIGYWHGGGDMSGVPYATAGPYLSSAPYNTIFIHGEYSDAAGSVIWAPGVTQSLPASFYLSSKPSWFGSVPFPPIGPDVSGGLANAYGHAYAIPAEVCYDQVMGGTDGTGSPLPFNANKCYGTGGSSPPPSGVPVVAFINPTNGATVSSVITISASVSDSTAAVTSVQFSAGGAAPLVDSASPWTFSWDTTQMPNGPQILALTAYDTVGNNASATIQVVVSNATSGTNPGAGAGLGNVIAYPNPWRSDRGYAQQITFKGLTGNTTVKIFTVSGHLVKTLSATTNPTTSWDLTNDSADRVASGVYIYLATNDQGQTARGKVVVIR
jgi:hypothetical protein